MKTFEEIKKEVTELMAYNDAHYKKEFRNIGELNKYFQDKWGVDYHICTLNRISTTVYTGKEGLHTWVRLRMDPVNDKQDKYFKRCQAWAIINSTDNFSFMVDLS